MVTLYKLKTGEVHAQNRTWLSELALIEDELDIYERKLNEISSKHPSKELQLAIALFRNKFINQKNEIVKFKDLIHTNEDEAVYSSQIHVRRISYNATDQYLDVKKNITRFENLFKELKDEFYSFSGRWMKALPVLQ